MQLIDALLGFAVLTGPLWLILILLPVSIWIAFKIAKRFKQRSAKVAVGLGTFVLVFFAPFADGIVGKIYFNHLCATKAGVKVYQTVELPAEYWDGEGRPRYLASNGFVDMKLLPNRFKWRNFKEPHMDSVIKIEKWRWEFVDQENETVLGEKITYMRYYGWINRFSTAPNIGESCRDLGGESNREELSRREREQEQKFFREILKPAASTR